MGKLDPSFLKSKGSMLRSLAEDDENVSPVKRGGRYRTGAISNQLQDSEESISSSGGLLNIPKGRDRQVSEPFTASTVDTKECRG